MTSKVSFGETSIFNRLCDGGKVTACCKFRFDNETTFILDQNIQITINYDVKWCRIYKNWILQRGFDIDTSGEIDASPKCEDPKLWSELCSFIRGI